MTYRVRVSLFAALPFFLFAIWATTTLGQVPDLPSTFELPVLDPPIDSGLGGETLGTQPIASREEARDSSKVFPANRKDLLEIERAAIEVAKQARACAVGLQVGRNKGSGVIISKDGYVLTAAHLISRPGQQVQVKFANGRTTQGTALGVHTTADGGLVKITEETEWPFMPLATKEQAAKLGDWCIAAGHPGGFDLKRSPPIRLGRVIEVQPTAIRTDCPIMGGDSGGPLFDLRGRVVGINSRPSDDLSENLHASSDAFHEAWDRMMDSKVYPGPVPSTFLALMDTDKDGIVTKAELKSDYHRRVFDRLQKSFELKGDELPIKSVARSSFKWRSDVKADIVNTDEKSQISLPRRDYTRGRSMKRLVENSLREVDDRQSDSDGDYVNQLTVRVYLDGRRVSLGTIVDKEGLVLTKLSQVVSEKADEVTCRMPDGSRTNANIVAKDSEYDLALLKIATGDLPEPVWNTNDVQPGQILAIPRDGGNLESIGVTSVPPREIKAIRPLLGLGTKDFDGNEVRVLAKNGGAERAGVQVGDIIQHVGDRDVETLQDIRRILNDYRAGDEVEIEIERNGDLRKLTVLLLSQTDMDFPGLDNWGLRDGPLSRVRDGFQSAFQIDALVKPQSCGGPVLDLNGHVLGLTLARPNRIATYAISAKDLQPVLKRMRSEASSTTTKTDSSTATPE